jgi:hypothetical protein
MTLHKDTFEVIVVTQVINRGILLLADRYRSKSATYIMVYGDAVSCLVMRFSGIGKMFSATR